MGFLSKVWRGVKKVAKGAAKRVKKIAKGIVTSLPGGQKLWKEGGRLGTKIMKGIGKITDALGPVGMIALSVLAPYAAPLWSSFGAAASAAGGFWGSVGTAVYNAGNWVAGTLGSMSKGISEAFSNIASGSFSKGIDAGVKGFADAFSGKAGTAAVEQGTQKALAAATANAVTDSTVNQIAQELTVNPNQFMDVAPTGPSGMMGQQTAYTTTKASITGAGVDVAATNPITGAIAGAETGGLMKTAGKVGKALLGGLGNQETGGYQAPMTSVGGQQISAYGARGEGGIGSTGGEFLSQDMQRRIQEAQARMSRGFGY